MLHASRASLSPTAADACALQAFDEEAAFLDYLLDDVWDILAQGARVRIAAAHTPTLATVRRGVPTVRTVVLRAVSRSRAILFIHADRRSGKVQELAAQPACSLHIYDPGRRVQLRIEAQATVHLDDDLAEAEWARLRSQYRAQQQRAVIAGNAVAIEPGIDDVDGLAEAGRREQFAAIALHVSAIEWQHVSTRGPQRARFEIGEHPRGYWLDA